MGHYRTCSLIIAFDGAPAKSHPRGYDQTVVSKGLRAACAELLLDRIDVNNLVVDKLDSVEIDQAIVIEGEAFHGSLVRQHLITQGAGDVARIFLD